MMGSQEARGAQGPPSPPRHSGQPGFAAAAASRDHSLVGREGTWGGLRLTLPPRELPTRNQGAARSLRRNACPRCSCGALLRLSGGRL